jgi:hypothetical protein
MSERCTKWRDAYCNFSLIMVPRCCDDIEVQKFLDGYFLSFNPNNVRSQLTSGQVFDAAKKQFGLLRCESVHYWEH